MLFSSFHSYKVMGKAISASTAQHFDLYDSHALGLIFGTWHQGWKLLLPALPIGIPLYFLKRHHVKPLVVLPVFLFVPIILFYAGVAAVGTTVEAARDDGKPDPTRWKPSAETRSRNPRANIKRVCECLFSCQLLCSLALSDDGERPLLEAVGVLALRGDPLGGCGRSYAPG